ncbi:MAG: SurA N-terminal domain-containing protein, partial [Actinomycetia bacterium]|nr:SurA N-terminal domain-containing protein [Actinomycetes bacterium]
MSLYSKYKKKILAIISTAVVVAFVATIFVAWGLQGYSSVKDTSVGSVNNEKISRMEYIDQLIQQENSFKQYGLPVDNEDVRRTIENMAFETAILEKLLFQKANPENIRISDQRIYNVISQNPDFQKDGVFSPELYHNLLKQSRYTEDKYEQKIIKKTLLVQTLKNLMLDTVRVSENITEDFFRLENYKAEVILYKLDTTRLKKGVKISENDILNYFENNKSTEFSSQKKHIRVKFVNIFPREVANRSVTESVVEEKYSSNKTDYTVEIKSWKISHLLFKKREEAEKYLKKVKSDKLKFDQYLEDKGSTLGWFQKRDMLSESFADAVY